jgi:hypothetical protein
MKLTEQEQDLIEVIRENASDDGFRLVLERQSGAWEVTFTAPIKGPRKLATVRGVGTSFAAAWDNMKPTWPEGPP